MRYCFLLSLCTLFVVVKSQGNNAVMISGIKFMNSDCSATVAPEVYLNSGKYNNQILCGYLSVYDVTGNAHSAYLGLDYNGVSGSDQSFSFAMEISTSTYNPDLCTFSSNQILSYNQPSTSCVTFSTLQTGLSENINAIFDFSQQSSTEVTITPTDAAPATQFLTFISWYPATTNCINLEPIAAFQVVNTACWPVPVYDTSNLYTGIQWGYDYCQNETSPTSVSFTEYSGKGCTSNTGGWGQSVWGYGSCGGYTDTSAGMAVWCGGDWDTWQEDLGTLSFTSSVCNKIYGNSLFEEGSCFPFCAYNDVGVEASSCNYGIVTCDCPGNSNSPWKLEYFAGNNDQCVGSPIATYQGTGITCVNVDTNVYISVNCHDTTIDPTSDTCSTTNNNNNDNANETGIIVGSVFGVIGFLAMIGFGIYYYFYWSHATSNSSGRSTSGTAVETIRSPKLVVENPISQQPNASSFA